ncbi:MAG TPA: hypothetical protein VNB64_14175, partial [Solirubrobacteraceae bacterium]|nr:hypothetical protein [Solirubrobacteraceae bacterium]
MSEIRVSRRLVKSPPELWAEVSDAESLARRLGELGEIRIARLEPETTVAWEGEHACGTVSIEGSGWGTAVTIRAEPVNDGAPAASEPAGETPGPDPTPGPPVPAPDPAPPSPAPPDPGPGPEPPSPGPQPGPPGPPAPGPQMEAPGGEAAPSAGFFARFFRRRPRAEPAAPDPRPEPAPEAEVPGPDPAPLPDPSPAPLPDPDPAPLPDPDPLPAPVHAVAATAPPEAPAGPSEPDLRAVLERMLDDLGAAHHRRRLPRQGRGSVPRPPPPHG